MNILVPDSWLRDFLQTKATPKQLKEYLSLCGPSIERIHEVGQETVYDVEVTTNRPDSMSVFGIAREAAAILPRFGVKAKLTGDPYETNTKAFVGKYAKEKHLSITTDPILNPRWTSIVIDNIKMGDSPEWMQKKLELSGIRPINIIVDVTNYLMRAYGQPAHAFDYDAVLPKKGVPTMILRASRKGETLTTLDGKTHTLPGEDIVIEDGSGRLIDLCGIMGAQNSAIKESTKTIVLFLQTYNPEKIRKTSMALSHRTEAAGLFEKGIDSELVLPAIVEGVKLITELTGATVASKLYDIYPGPYKSKSVSVSKQKVNAYIGSSLTKNEIKNFLAPLGFSAIVTKDRVEVTVPSFRRDIEIDVDIIEEIARIYGYHIIPSKLPDSQPPIKITGPSLRWEEEIKIRLRDWGFIETYTYSMISEELMKIFGLDKARAYKISNPLTKEWVYMRPSLWPSVLENIAKNLNIRDEFKTFELSMTYSYRDGNLPLETPILLVAWVGNRILEAKGLSEAIFSLCGIDFPDNDDTKLMDWYSKTSLSLGRYGSLGEVHPGIRELLGIKKPITILELEFDRFVEDAKPTKQYSPIPKYPPIVEDLAFVVPHEFPIGPLTEALKKVDPLIAKVELLDSHKDTRTMRIYYLDKTKNLTTEEVKPIRAKLITLAESDFSLRLRTS